MFLFLKLVLAHLIADFILQFEELYQLKVRSFLGQLFHVLIQGLVALVLLFPYLNEPVIWAFVAGLVAVHLIQDLIKYSLTRKMPAHTFAYFMIDQACHILATAAILFFPISREVRGLPDLPFLDALYRNNVWTIGLIFFITLTFAGSYILNAFSKSYLKGHAPRYLISSPEMVHAIVERSLVAGILLFSASPWMTLLAPCVGVLRLPFKPLRDLKGFLMSMIYAITVTLLFKMAL